MNICLEDKDAVFLSNLFNNNGLRPDNVELSVIFNERYGKKVVEFDGKIPFLFKVTPQAHLDQAFLVLVFSDHLISATRFCANHYPVQSVEYIDLRNTWVLLNNSDVEQLEKEK